MSDTGTFVLAAAPKGFGEFGPEDDALHPERNREIESYALTETQYFGFSVPEHRIHGIGYFWHHERLSTVTGGIAAWQGVKRFQAAAEIFDMRSYMSDQIVRDGLSNYRMDSGYGVEVIEPMRKFRIHYEDPARGNAVDILYTAVSDPMMLPNRKHFEQVMKTDGTIALRGKSYKVDGYNVRDRSWAEARSEMQVNSPPVAWMTGVFGDNFAFNCLCSEDPARDVEWKDVYPETAANPFKGGWLMRNGRRQRIVAASSVVKRDPVSLHPLEIHVQLVDEDGSTHDVAGFVRASSPVSLWPNVHVPVCLTEWHWDGRVGHGDTQECQWTDFLHARGGE
ncbi:hypothetical protein SAMN02927924_01955 [Sphingobium faniae]|nr:hypothetical protein SAMN02927924_01955 [Sphingobium faniae]